MIRECLAHANVAVWPFGGYHTAFTCSCGVIEVRKYRLLQDSPCNQGYQLCEFTQSYQKKGSAADIAATWVLYTYKYHRFHLESFGTDTDDPAQSVEAVLRETAESACDQRLDERTPETRLARYRILDRDSELHGGSGPREL